MIIFICALFSCSNSSSDSGNNVNDSTPTSLYPSDYALKNSNGTNLLYVYFGVLNNPFTSSTVSSTFEQGSYTNKIIYTYNKPNGTILIGPKTPGSPTPTSNLTFQENSTYPFTINGQTLTIMANGQNYILTKEP